MKIKSFILPVLFLSAAYSQELKWASFEWVSYIHAGRKYERTAMLVPVRLQHVSGTYWMQLDTGSDASMIYEVPFNQLDGSVQPEKTRGMTATLSGTVGEYAFGSLPFRILKDFGDSLTGRDTLPVIGTIGLDILKGKVLVLDFPKQKFCLLDSPAGLPEEYRLHAMFADITDRNNKLFVHLEIADTSSDDFFYDTGSSMFSLSTTKNLWQRLTGLQGDEPGNAVIRVQSWGKEALLIGAPARGSLKFGGLEVKNPYVYFDSTGLIDFSAWPFKADGLLGNALFYDRYVVILDLVRHKFGVLADQ